MQASTILSWTIGLLLVLLLAGAAPATAAPPPAADVPNPGADLWRAVRQRDDTLWPARTQAPRPDDAVLIDPAGEHFRQFRRERFIRYAGWGLAGTLGLIFLYFVLHGPIRHEGGDSGERILRFRRLDRILHWVLAVTFLVLGLTGLLLLFGRLLIIPWLGNAAFGPVAEIGKWVHNLTGPLFIVALLLFFLRFVGRNLPALADLKWLARLGGLLGKSHPPAGFFNAGEKIWFWLLVLGGVAVSVSGVVLDFPTLVEAARQPLRLALVVHGIAAVLLLAASLGHMYLGSIGMKGALQSMISGYVDANWARAHHLLWYEKLRGRR